MFARDSSDPAVAALSHRQWRVAPLHSLRRPEDNSITPLMSVLRLHTAVSRLCVSLRVVMSSLVDNPSWQNPPWLTPQPLFAAGPVCCR